MKCEKCKSEHDGSYGSGRFCSVKCSRGFSGSKSKGTSKKWKVLTGETITKICPTCNTKFTNYETSSRKKKYCSTKCTINKDYKWSSNPDRDTSNMGGFREKGGKSKVNEYKCNSGEIAYLNNEEIRLAKILDVLNIKWNRNKKGFKYVDLNGKERKYYPDFYIEDLNRYVEYKGWVVPKMEHKMKEVVKTHKIDLLIIYGMDKRYKKLGLNIEEVENKPDLILTGH